MGGGVGRSAVTASEGKLTLMKSGRKKRERTAANKRGNVRFGALELDFGGDA